MTFHYLRRARIKPATAAPSRLWLLHRNSCETVKRSEWHPPVFILILVFVSGHCADCQDCYLTSRPEWLTISACPQSTLNTQCDNIQITLQVELCSLSFFFLIFLSNLSFLSYHHFPTHQGTMDSLDKLSTTLIIKKHNYIWVCHIMCHHCPSFSSNLSPFVTDKSLKSGI